MISGPLLEMTALSSYIAIEASPLDLNWKIQGIRSSEKEVPK